ncbi:AaceriADL235Wp [[Ashbya] aceris (nom. inval.)]|nr:AaceriADL235Wp [[Ashbya] aceris (nom. inval.)]
MESHQAVLVICVVSGLFLAVASHEAVRRLVCEWILKPPTKFRDSICEALLRGPETDQKPVLVDVGWRHGAVRRQIILASERPNDYSNELYGSKIHISSEDVARGRSFADALEIERPSRRILFGFFHPFCNAGGGGEKVLWKAVETTLKQSTDNVVVVYTGDYDTTGASILSNVAHRFGYQLDSERIVFIFLRHRKWVESETWPRMTLLGQALGSVVLSIEAALCCPPDVWCDTMGYPFGYPFISWLCRIPIVTYTHYPVVSVDMLDKLRMMPVFRSSPVLWAKFLYWKTFMRCYTFVGSFVDVAVTNSTWTYNHMNAIWNQTRNVTTIYPPCSTEKLVTDDSTDVWNRKNQAVVVAQFRPEKRHELILRSFSNFIKKTGSKMKLLMLGSTRGQDDRNYVKKLEQLAYSELAIPKESLEFLTDCKYEVMRRYLQESSFGINAMWNEHFGIAVVEYAASGLITLAHASAGPLLDIIVPWDIEADKQLPSDSDSNRTGFFFKDRSDPDYSKVTSGEFPTLEELFVRVDQLTEEERLAISQRAKRCVLHKFSDLKFSEDWTQILDRTSQILRTSRKDKVE